MGISNLGIHFTLNGRLEKYEIANNVRTVLVDLYF